MVIYLFEQLQFLTLQQFLLTFKPSLLGAITVLEGILEVCFDHGAIVIEKPAEESAEIHDSYKKLHGDEHRTKWRDNHFTVK